MKSQGVSGCIDNAELDDLSLVGVQNELKQWAEFGVNNSLVRPVEHGLHIFRRRIVVESMHHDKTPRRDDD
jgi:hypothetical protein